MSAVIAYLLVGLQMLTDTSEDARLDFQKDRDILETSLW
jgi:hypothetical protein